MINLQQPFHVFSASDVRTALPMPEAVDAMRGALRELSTGQVVVPLRTHMELTEQEADVLVMSAYSPRLDHIGLKVITLHPDNPERGLPFIQATVMLIDADRGSPLAVMSGAVLTAIRTGAASGVATEVLSRPDSKHVAVFGAGVQAMTQLEAVCAVRSIRSAAVFDLDQTRAATFAQRMADALKITIAPAVTPSAALADADIVCTATTARTPVFDDRDIAPGTHINAIGVYKPDEREIPAATVARARVVVDERNAAWAEAGELIQARDEGLIDGSHIHAEVGEILAGGKSGRQSDDEVTLFKSVGVANEDLSAAHVVLARGTKLGLGSSVSL